MAIGVLCAFKPFEMAVRPFGKIFGESADKRRQTKTKPKINIIVIIICWLEASEVDFMMYFFSLLTCDG